MAENLRVRPLYLLAAILTAWATEQFWLCRHAVQTLKLTALSTASQFEATHPGVIVHINPVSSTLWLRAGLESVGQVILPTIVAIFLVAGGRRWLAATVAAYPLCNVLGAFHGGPSLGLGWEQPTWVHLWFTYGVFVDTALLMLVVALIVKSIPEQPEAAAIRWGFTRVIPAVIVLAGWWVTRHPSPTSHDWVWLGEAVSFMLVAALLTDSNLPVGGRVVAIGLILPLTTGTILNDLVAPHQIGFPAMYFLHHALIALGVAAYVAGAPKAFGWLLEPSGAATA